MGGDSSEIARSPPATHTPGAAFQRGGQPIAAVSWSQLQFLPNLWNSEKESVPKVTLPCQETPGAAKDRHERQAR